MTSTIHYIVVTILETLVAVLSGCGEVILTKSTMDLIMELVDRLMVGQTDLVHCIIEFCT